jgi:hypothetical protein
MNRYGIKSGGGSLLEEPKVSYKPASREDLAQIVDHLIAHKVLDLTHGQAFALAYFQGVEIPDISSKIHRPEMYVKSRLTAVGRKLTALGLDPSDFMDLNEGPAQTKK